MSCTSTTSWISSFFDWLHETCSGCEDRNSERQRLARLSNHNQSLKHIADDMLPVLETTENGDSELDTDNYLRGQLLDSNHDAVEKHNRETVSHWLHPEAVGEKKNHEVSQESRPLHSRATGELDYLISETRLLEFTDIGMGMDKACLSSFIGRQSAVKQDSDVPRSTREFMMRKTTRDIPVLKSQSNRNLSFLPLEEANEKLQA